MISVVANGFFFRRSCRTNFVAAFIFQIGNSAKASTKEVLYEISSLSVVKLLALLSICAVASVTINWHGSKSITDAQLSTSASHTSFMVTNDYDPDHVNHSWSLALM
jgi:hypothetical protein